MHYTYSTLYGSTRLPFTAKTSNNKFIAPQVQSTHAKPNFAEWKTDPSQWGPHLWYYLHFSSANYPDTPSTEQQKAMRDWLCSLSVTIPCKSCSNHFHQYIERHKQDLGTICSSRDNLFRFLVDVHNKVNSRKGKSPMTHQAARELYYK